MADEHPICAGVPPRAQPGTRGVKAACALSYAGVWTATGLAAALVRMGGRPFATAVHEALGLKLAGTGVHAHPLANIAVLLAHNLPIAAWPLLLGIAGADRTRAGRAVGDVLVFAGVAANSIPVGAALGAYGSALLAYVPQLPVEWAALALGAAAWIIERRRALSRQERVIWLAAIVVAVLAAATLETMAVPSG